MGRIEKKNENGISLEDKMVVIQAIFNQLSY
jgi:hypothetical protein